MKKKKSRAEKREERRQANARKREAFWRPYRKDAEARRRGNHG